MSKNIYVYGVKLHDTTLIYYSFNQALKTGTKLVVDDPSLGLTIGIIETVKEVPQDAEDSFLKAFRVATKDDEKLAELISHQEEDIYKYVVETVERYNMDMRVLRCLLSLDSSKLLIIYSADERVDFREIVKDFAKKFRTHIEMRQIGSRDRAQLVGGIGVCGLKLCCSTFIKNFDVISINMAKNQLLSLNIPKLSGQCGKLICCLKYEDDNYAQLRKQSPRIGDKYIIDKKEFHITGINLLTGLVTLTSGEEFLNIDKEELRKKYGHRER